MVLVLALMLDFEQQWVVQVGKKKGKSGAPCVIGLAQPTPNQRQGHQNLELLPQDQYAFFFI